MSDIGAKLNPGILTPDITSGKLGKIVFVGSIPEANDCLYLGPMASVSTEITFGQFLHNDHSLTAWFMPQFPFSDCGAIFGTFGPGTYMVGQGDYRTGDTIFRTKKGSPVLTVVIGAQRARYLAPSWQAGTWHHIAVVRKTGTIGLYLDGLRLQPVSIVSTKDAEGNITATSTKPAAEVKLAQSFSGEPTGRLQLGSGRHPHRVADAQSYGLLDDVTLFDRALSDNELKGLVNAKRTTGKEPGLVAGWNFDTSPSFLPLALRSKMKAFSVVDDLRISANRDSAKDRALLTHPAVLDDALVAVSPPFQAGEEWLVQQGVNDPLGSHCGYAAFCWDLQRVGMSTGNASVRSCLSGEVYSYVRD